YPSSDHKDFEWNWNGYSDTKLNTAFLYQFTNVHFRLSWPKDGTVFLDITDGTLTTTNYNVIIPRTNFPPNGPYYAEFLGDSEGLNRILAAGRVNIQHSIWQNTDQSTWTNPVGGMVIGPPFHTISTPYTNWPFVSEVVVNEVDGASSGSITSGTLIINVSTNHAINLATNTLNAHYVNIDGDTMTGKLHMGADLNMAGFSVTNIASSSIGFADGTSFGSANVILWNSVTNSGAGTITNIVAGT
ncbi:MAG: hypothetical protein GWO08_17080, partial [Gammaproteobacteria bacterium]|nr:hypothetical protein [Gammaproteobacteria bacterium]NIR95298.1 hypothetical protein [Gammaproteobacteria bacterium]